MRPDRSLISRVSGGWSNPGGSGSLWRALVTALVGLICVLGLTSPSDGIARDPQQILYLDGVESDTVDIVPGFTTYLEPAAPSPFIGSTDIAYTLKEETTVSLKIHDFFYLPVATLVDEAAQPAGRYVVTFNPGGTISSGVYFCTLETPDARQVRRFIYLR